jgi:transposase-like protein
MVKSGRSRTRYSEEFKLSVLKDMYENKLSVLGTAKKYGLTGGTTYIYKWEKEYPVDSKLLSLSDEVITRIKSMRKKNKPLCQQTVPQTREEELIKEVEDLRKALAYSELRNEALHEVLNIGKERYGIDLLKKAGAKQ